MTNILLTGGRAPATLELCRAFHHAQHHVFTAESVNGHLSQFSNSVSKNFLVPPPRQQTHDFIHSLNSIVQAFDINLIIPTCEEVFYIAAFRESITCPVFIDSFEKLAMLHNKWAFINKAREFHLPVPETLLLSNQDDLHTAFSTWQDLVIKPAYSRFAKKTLILPSLQDALHEISFEDNVLMVAQEYLSGKEISTYSICHNGHVTAHTTYESNFTAGRTGTVLLSHVSHPSIETWVKTFVEGIQFTGQIAFDFIENSNSGIYAIECNPHANGIPAALLSSHPQFTSAILEPTSECIKPEPGFSAMMAAGMLLYGLPASLRDGLVSRWFHDFVNSRDFLFRFNDPMPAFLQFQSLYYYFQLAKKKGISILEATMFDIEWNGSSEFLFKEQ